MKAKDKRPGRSAERKRWASPKLTFLGHVGGIVQGGSGKLTTQPADPGETRKTPPSH